MFGDTVDIGNYSMIPENSYDDFMTKVQWAGTTGENELLLEKQHFIVYPNPASDRITVSVEDESILYFEMIDKTGRQVLYSNTTNETSVHSNVTSVHACQSTYNINISGLHTGLYVLNIYTKSNKLLSKKVVVK